jgi:hypothetical protein
MITEFLSGVGKTVIDCSFHSSLPITAKQNEASLQYFSRDLSDFGCL